MAKSHLSTAFFSAFYEYLLVTFPVALYVLLEAVHKEKADFFLISPEWSIATIFLAFQGFSLYVQALRRIGRTFFEPLIGMLGLYMLATIVAASANAFHSLHSNTSPAIVFRLLLFVLTSLVFFLLVVGAKLAAAKKGV